jgi:hypothetical protein
VAIGVEAEHLIARSSDPATSSPKWCSGEICGDANASTGPVAPAHPGGLPPPAIREPQVVNCCSEQPRLWHKSAIFVCCSPRDSRDCPRAGGLWEAERIWQSLAGSGFLMCF